MSSNPSAVASPTAGAAPSRRRPFRPLLLLPVESSSRELDARVLLAATAATRGFSVLLLRYIDLPQVMPLVPPAVVLHMNALGTEAIGRIVESGHIAVALDEEGLVQRNAAEYGRRRLSAEALERCSRFFAWGEVHRAAVLDRVPGVADRVVVAGNPRMDLLRPDLRRLYDDERAHLVDRYGRFMLLNSNLGTLNHRLGTDLVRAQWQQNGWEASDPGLLDALLGFQGQLFDGFCELARDLAQERPEETIVVRPHPAEDHARWRARLGHLPNVVVIHEGSVIPWLLASAALVHNGCTTAIEATLLGRQALAFMPVREPELESSLPNEISTPVSLATEVLAATTGEVEAAPRPGETDPFAHLRPHIAQLEGPRASDVIAAALESLAAPPAALPARRSFSLRLRSARMEAQARSRASVALGRSDRRDRRSADFLSSAAPKIEPRAVQSLVERMHTLTGSYGSLAVTGMGNDVVLVEGKGA